MYRYGGSPAMSALTAGFACRFFTFWRVVFKEILNTTRQKVKNLQANPAVSALIAGDPPYRYIELRGEAEIAPYPDYEFADKIGAKYGGADLRTRDQPGDTRVVVT